MADGQPAIVAQLLGFWRNLSRARRIALVAVTGLVLAGVVAISWLGNTVRYAPLYRGLDPEDAGLVLTKLKDMQVPTRVSLSGTLIEVPRQRVHELRLELASSGLPRGGGVGFEIFDKSELGSTQFEQTIKLRRALEGELARSVATLESVQSARIHLVMRENRLFTAREEGASASVIVKPKPGRELGRREVAGIVHLVSLAVPGLSREQLSVVSTDGQTLHSPGGDAGGGLFEPTRAQQALKMARTMEANVRTLLENVAGRGGVDVRVHIELEYQSRERTEEHFDPVKAALRSEHKTAETTNEEGATVAGVPGAQSNLPDVEASAAARETEEGGRRFRESQTRNWEVDRTTERVKTPPGSIRRVTVAVLIDGTYEEKEGAELYSPRSPEELKRLEEIAMNAVGFSALRGDTIRIESARFQKPDVEMLEPTFWDKYRELLPYALGLAGLLTLLSMFLIFMRTLKSHQLDSQGETQSLAEGEQAESEQAEGEAGPGLTEDSSATSEDPTDSESADPIDGEDEDEDEDEGKLSPLSPEETEQLRQQALALAADNPSTAALVLSQWLSEPATQVALPIAASEQAPAQVGPA